MTAFADDLSRERAWVQTEGQNYLKTQRLIQKWVGFFGNAVFEVVAGSNHQEMWYQMKLSAMKVSLELSETEITHAGNRAEYVSR
jgi:hypothetical protein